MDKNVKEEEMRYIIGMQDTRKSREKKDSIFYVRSRRVPLKKIERFRQRKNLGRMMDVPHGKRVDEPRMTSQCTKS